MISHGILPIFPPNCTKFVVFFVTSKKLSSALESLHFLAENVNAKSRKRDGHGKIFCQVFGKIFVQVCGNPGTIYYYRITCDTSLPKPGDPILPTDPTLIDLTT